MKTYQTKEEKKALKARKKEYKKRIISTYGRMYYLRDKTWLNIKDQRPDETDDAWKRRLEFYGFSVNGEELKSGVRHYAEPVVAESNKYLTPVEEVVEEVAEAAVEEETEEVAEEATEEATEEAAEEVAEEATEEAAEEVTEEATEEVAPEAIGFAEDAVAVEVLDAAVAEALADLTAEVTEESTVEEAAEPAEEVAEEVAEEAAEEEKTAEA